VFFFFFNLTFKDLFPSLTVVEIIPHIWLRVLALN